MLIKTNLLKFKTNNYLQAILKQTYCSSIQIGSKASLSKVFTQSDINKFAGLSLDNNEIHLNENAARSAGFEKQIVHGFLVNSYVFHTM